MPDFLLRPALIALAVLLVAGAGFTAGSLYMAGKWRQDEANRAAEAVKIVTRQGAVTERDVIKYRDRAKVQAGVTTTIEKEVTKYVESKPLALACNLDLRWVRLHDAAAAGAIPPPAGDADAAPGAVSAAQALPTVTANYAACGRNADRLEALQGWVRGQYEATNGEPLRW